VVSNVNKHTNVIPGVFALSAFMLASIAGLIAGNPASQVLIKSIIAMFICNLVGAGASKCIQLALDDHAAAYAKANPIPEFDEGSKTQPVGVKQT
jgi:hypothetical protein